MQGYPGTWLSRASLAGQIKEVDMVLSIPKVEVVQVESGDKYRVATSRLGTGWLVSVRKDPGTKPIPARFFRTRFELASFLDRILK